MFLTKIRFSIVQKLLLLFSFLGLFAAQVFFLLLYRDIQRDKQVSAATLCAESVATSIHLTLKENVVLSDTLKGLYVKYHENFVNDFGMICEDMIPEGSVVKSVFIAPYGIVKAVYPYHLQNTDAMNFRIFDRSELSTQTKSAVNNRQMTVTGPHNLFEGGVGLAIRNPIFEDDNFTALCIVSLDWTKFVSEVLSRIPSKNSGYNIGVWTENTDGTVTDEYGFIFKNCDKDVSRLVNLEIVIPSGMWHLAVEPSAGWKNIRTMGIEIFISIIIFLLAFFTIVLRMYTNAKNIYLAEHDDLTDLLSRSTFLKKTEALIKSEPETKIIIVAADIENFKVNNSMYGTEKCDDVLKYLADCYVKLSPFNLCTRFGSDHFVFILKSNSEEEDTKYLENVAEKISAEAPIENLTVKYGFYNEVESDIPVNLLCDKALLAAKSILHNYETTVSNYKGPLSIKNEKSQLFESSFLKALNNDNFKIWLQPKFDAVTEKLVGAEALVRWITDDGTIISPVDFIKVFEDDGLIYKLDLYVFEKVCQKIKFWLDKGYDLIPISVNISRTSLQHKNVIKEYQRIVNDIGINSDYVPLEITESSTTSNKHIKELTEDLKSTGFKIHMDDFGTGLSSLESLNLLPFDVIKLDKSLIDFIGTPVGEELLRHIIELVQFMNLKIIAEGVETKEQLEFLRKLKCDHIQGYYYSAPMSYENFVEYLKKNHYNE